MNLKKVILSGEEYGIKRLSTYDYLKCDAMSNELFERLLEQNFDKDLSKTLSENASIISRCLFNSESLRAFEDGLAVLENLTPLEIKKICSLAR